LSSCEEAFLFGYVIIVDHLLNFMFQGREEVHVSYYKKFIYFGEVLNTFDCDRE